MIKSVSVLLGVMIFISSLYYLTFWGSFQIDVFQYMQVPDIIKGTVYAFGDVVNQLVLYVLVLSVALTIAVLTARRVVVKRKNKDLSDIKRQFGVLYFMMWISIIIAFVFGSMHYIILYSGPIEYGYLSGIFALPTVSLAFTLFYVLADYNNTFKKDKMALYARAQGNDLLVLADYTLVFIVVYLMVSAYSLGRISYRNIVGHISYDCLQNVADLRKEGMYTNKDVIYVGAISDKYIFWEDNTNNHFIVDKYKMPILYLNHSGKSKKNAELLDGINELWNLINKNRTTAVLVLSGFLISINFVMRYAISKYKDNLGIFAK